MSSGEIVFINLDYKQVSLTMGQTGQVLRVDYPGHEREIMVLSEESLQLSLTPLLLGKYRLKVRARYLTIASC